MAVIRHDPVISEKRCARIRARNPVCEAGVWLADADRFINYDLSDGLSTDLPRTCAGSGAAPHPPRRASGFFREARWRDCDPIELALHGGEDYELLSAVPNSKSRSLEELYPSKFPKLTQIGRMTRILGKHGSLSPGKHAGDYWIVVTITFVPPQ